MIVTTTDFVPGREIGEALDIVRGSTIRAKHVGKDILAGLRTLVGGMVFVNLGDFDMNFGHRRDPAGYRGALEEFDEKLVWVEERLRDDDLVILTADHGNDPTKSEHTDHTREYVPLVVYGKNVKGGVDLGTRATFADVAATIAENFELPYECDGKSFLDEVWAG